MLTALDEASRPTGTITFLFSDIEGSTELAVALGPAGYREALELHQQLLRAAFIAHEGIERGTEGDSFFVVFRHAPAAVAAAVDAQRSIAAKTWPPDVAVRVRMGIHTGEGVPGGDDYVGLDINRAARIAAAAHGGQVLLSEATRALTGASLPDGVGVLDVGRHRLKGLPEREHIYQLTIAGLPSDFPAIRSLDPSMTNLPARTSSFVGRDREVQEIAELVHDNALVTLTGPGGTGKTSLATEVARRVAEQFDDGAWFVPLDAIADPQLVASAIVAGLGLRDVTGRPARERLLDNLPGRNLLLVLDNFEQVVEAAPLIAEMLAAAVGVKAIVTSRAPLRLSAEQLYPVGPLEVRDTAGEGELTQIASIPSVQLFVERAKRVQPDFTLTAGNAAVIVEICQRLDGLPLGIELAAARIPLLGATGIRDRLARQLGLGGTAARDVPARQRTLEDTIGWSHDLLDAAGQTLFARLAVFANGWRIEQAEEVCGPGTEIEGRVADIAAGLAEQSLVTTRLRDDGVRFGMLETVRQDATRRLNLDAARDWLKQRHALAYLALAEEHGAALDTRDAASALARLEEERDNLRAALQWAIATGNAEVGLRLGRALYLFWGLTGEIQEGSATLAAIFALPGAEVPTVWRMRALEAAGNLSYYTGDSVHPRQMYLAQLELARALGDGKGMADARYNLAFTEYSPVEWQAALAELDALVAEYQALGEDRAKARVHWARATRLAQGGRPAEALVILEQAVPQYRALGDNSSLTQAAGLLSALSFELGDPANAVHWLVEALSAATQAGNLPSLTAGLPSIAMAAFHLGRPTAAATILGAYESLSRRYGVRMPQNLQASQDALDPLDQVAAAISAEAYEAAYKRGTLMSIDEVVDFVMELAGAG